MLTRTPEAEWKKFRKLRTRALDRFCHRVLGELDAVRQDDSRTQHERYLAVFRLLKHRDKELARMFDDPRRSNMIVQLALIDKEGLLEPDEFAQFSEATQQEIELYRLHFLR